MHALYRCSPALTNKVRLREDEPRYAIQLFSTYDKTATNGLSPIICLLCENPIHYVYNISFLLRVGNLPFYI